jgi:hypothetical protein
MMRESVSVVSGLFLVGLWCSAAAAAPVDNPGNFVFSSGGAQFQFNQRLQIIRLGNTTNPGPYGS